MVYFRVKGLGYRRLDVEFRVKGPGFRFLDVEVRVRGLGFRCLYVKSGSEYRFLCMQYKDVGKRLLGFGFIVNGCQRGHRYASYAKRASLGGNVRNIVASTSSFMPGRSVAMKFVECKVEAIEIRGRENQDQSVGSKQ